MCLPAGSYFNTLSDTAPTTSAELHRRFTLRASCAEAVSVTSAQRNPLQSVGMVNDHLEGCFRAAPSEEVG